MSFNSERKTRSPRQKVAGEIVHVKDTEVKQDTWGWGNHRNDLKRIIQPEMVFQPKNLKPLASSLRSALMSLGHVVSAYNTFAKIKSRNISPDGALGGKGYVQRIPDMRRQLMNCVEALSAFTDTVYDEINAPHWSPTEDIVDARTRDEVRDMLNDVENIKEDPGAWAEGEEEEFVATAKTAGARASVRNVVARYQEKLREK